MDYLALKWLHILSSTVLFGTGIGSAFYLLLSTPGRDVRTVARVSGYVAAADRLFTATTAGLQPITGWRLVRSAGLHWSRPWRWFLVCVAPGFVAFIAFPLIFWLMVAKQLPWMG